MKIQIFVLLLSLFMSISFADRPGTRCDYAANGDSECDIRISQYCIDFLCTEYLGTVDKYCEDSDGNEPSMPGYVDAMRRTATGAFSPIQIRETCVILGRDTESCDAGTSCSVKEYFCASRSSDYSSDVYLCIHGCSGGACLNAPNPEPQTYAITQTSSANRTNSTNQANETIDDNEETVPVGTGTQNTLNETHKYEYSFGNWPKEVTDANLLEYIDLWSKGELAGNEQDNDFAIKKIMEIWKNT